MPSLFDGLDSLMRGAPLPAVKSTGLQAQIIGNSRSIGGRGRWHEYLSAFRDMPFLRVVADVFGSNYAAVRWKVLAPASGQSPRGLGWLTGASARERRREVRALVKGGELREVEPHLFFDVWRAGNSDLSGFQQRRLSVLYRLLAGEAPLYLARNLLGAPAQAWILPPIWVRRTPRETGREVYEVQAPGGRAFDIPQADILLLKDPDLVDPYGRGCGVARAVATELDTDEEMALWNRTYFANNARPELLITMPGAGEAERKVARKEWAQELAGAYRAHQTHFFGVPEGATVNVQDLSRSMSDLLFTDQRKMHLDFVRQVIARCPPELLGDVENSNRATIDAASYLFSRGTLVPILEDDRERLEAFCRQEYDERITIEYQSPVDEDWEFRRAVMSSAAFAFSIDEFRDLAEVPPLANGQGKAHMLPLGVTPTMTPGQDPYAAPAPPSEEQGPAASSDGRRAWWTLAYRPLGRASGKPNPAIDRIARRSSRLLERAFRAAIRDARGQVDVDAIERELDQGDVEAALDLLPVDFLSERMLANRGILQATLTEAGTAAADHLGRQIGEAVAFDPGERRIREWLARRVGDLDSWIQESTRESAREVVERELAAAGARATAEAVQARLGVASNEVGAISRELARLADEGASSTERKKRESQLVGDRVDARATSFGELQAIAPSQEGQRQSWRQAQDAGQISAKAVRVWLTRNVGEECERCDSLHGQERSIDDAFDSPAAPDLVIMTPGDPHEGWDRPCYCGVVLVSFS